MNSSVHGQASKSRQQRKKAFGSPGAETQAGHWVYINHFFDLPHSHRLGYPHSYGNVALSNLQKGQANQSLPSHPFHPGTGLSYSTDPEVIPGAGHGHVEQGLLPFEAGGLLGFAELGKTGEAMRVSSSAGGKQRR